MKNLVYILLGIVAAAFTGCSKFDADSELKTSNPPSVIPQDTVPKTPDHQWSNVIEKVLPIDDKMIARPAIYWACTDGKQDTSYMEPWKLDIDVIDLTVYRDSYQSSSRLGKTPNAERSEESEVTDKLGNLVVRHHYQQAFMFNNFTHKIEGSWTTGRLFYGNGKEESYLPEDGLYYELTDISGNTVNDTVHFVRNDSIFAKEVVKLTYKASLHKIAGKPKSRETWERTATITVISFVGLVEKPIPGADDYIPNLEWHAEKANRFWNGSQWCDGILFSSSTHYYMLVTTFKLNHDGTKEEPLETKMYSIAKSAMVTPEAGREFNAVMWDEAKNQPIPCVLTVDGDGWSLGSRYADGTKVTKRHKRSESVMAGVKNLSEEDNATPSPWIASTWTESQYNSVNYYAVTWKTTTHTMSRTIADANLK